MLDVSSSYVASTLRTTMMNPSFSVTRTAPRAVAPKLRCSHGARGQHRDPTRQEKGRKRSFFPDKSYINRKPFENYAR